MEFAKAPAQRIMSISQRSLALNWFSMSRERMPPSFRDFSPPERIHDPRQLAFWKVTGEGNDLTFKVLLLGENIREGLGEVLDVGSSMEVLPEPLRAIALAGSQASVRSARPIYMVIGTTDEDGNPVQCERLVLPFSSGSARVDVLVGSLQLVSVAGSFSRRSVLARFKRQASLILAGEIVP